MKRRRLNTKGLVCRTNPNGSNSYISPEVALHQKLKKGIINQEELRIYVELTHTESKQIVKTTSHKIAIRVFNRLIEVTQEEYHMHCRYY